MHSRLAAAVSLILSTATCAAAPTSPSHTAGNRIIITDAAGLLAPVRSTLDDVLERALSRANASLPLSGVTITVTPDASRAIGGYGVGGFTSDGRTISLYVDPSHTTLGSALDARLSLMLAHEWHHAARFRGPGYGRTLLEAIVSEGLADHFAVDLLGAETPPWSRALTAEGIVAWTAQAREHFDTNNYGHERWFFGATPDVPRWTGYTLGHHLIERYRAAHPGATAVTLVNAPANTFRP